MRDILQRHMGNQGAHASPPTKLKYKDQCRSGVTFLVSSQLSLYSFENWRILLMIQLPCSTVNHARTLK